MSLLLALAGAVVEPAVPSPAGRLQGGDDNSRDHDDTLDLWWTRRNARQRRMNNVVAVHLILALAASGELD
jgi:hypothetical protein